MSTVDSSHTHTNTHTHTQTHKHTSGLQDVSHGISEVVLGLELIAKFLVHFVLLKYSGKCVMCCNMQKLNIFPHRLFIYVFL